MKKVLLIILAFVLVLSLAACGGSGSTTAGTTTPESTGDAPAIRPSDDAPLVRPGNDTPTTPSPDANTPSLSTVIGGDTLLSEYDEATKQAWIDEASAVGCKLEFKPDGSAVYTDDEGSVIIQQPDGTWATEGEEGGLEQVGGGWPDNEFTKLIPKPDFTVNISGVDGNSFAVTFSDATIDQIKEYTEQVKAAGFTLDAETEDLEAAGMVIYSYTAGNADGYVINVFSASGVAGLSIEKP